MEMFFPPVESPTQLGATITTAFKTIFTVSPGESSMTISYPNTAITESFQHRARSLPTDLASHFFPILLPMFALTYVAGEDLIETSAQSAILPRSTLAGTVDLAPSCSAWKCWTSGQKAGTAVAIVAFIIAIIVLFIWGFCYDSNQRHSRERPRHGDGDIEMGRRRRRRDRGIVLDRRRVGRTYSRNRMRRMERRTSSPAARWSAGSAEGSRRFHGRGVPQIPTQYSQAYEDHLPSASNAATIGVPGSSTKELRQSPLLPSTEVQTSAVPRSRTRDIAVPAAAALAGSRLVAAASRRASPRPAKQFRSRDKSLRDWKWEETDNSKDTRSRRRSEGGDWENIRARRERELNEEGRSARR